MKYQVFWITGVASALATSLQVTLNSHEDARLVGLYPHKSRDLEGFIVVFEEATP